MLLIPHGLGAPSQTAQENHPTVRSGEASETAFLTIFDAAVPEGDGREGEALFEMMPEAEAPGDSGEVGNTIEPPTEGGVEGIPIDDIPSHTPVVEETWPHAHGVPGVKDTEQAQTWRKPESSHPSMPHTADTAPTAAKAPGSDSVQSGTLAHLAPPPTTFHWPETDQRRAWPEDQKQALKSAKSNKMHWSSASVGTFATHPNPRHDVPQNTGIKTRQGTGPTTLVEDRPPAFEAGALVRSEAGQAVQAERVVQPRPAAPPAANTMVQPAKDTASPFIIKTSVKNHGDHPQSWESGTKPPQQFTTSPQPAAMPSPAIAAPMQAVATPMKATTTPAQPATTPMHALATAMQAPEASTQPTASPAQPTTTPMQATAAPIFKPELTEEIPRSPVSHDDARADVRLTAEGGPRPAGPLLQSPQSHDLPRHVAQQIVEALQRGAGGKDRGVDLLLNPAELGRVRISLSPGDAGLTVHIIADRPETLDLMRRHSDMLAQDFQGLGYEATDFAFAQHDHEGEDQEGDAPQQHTPHVIKAADANSQVTATIITDRVDIRL